MKAVIYARYSAGPRQTDQSIEGQVRVCTNFCKQKGLEVVEVYADRHISGKTDERPEFQRLIADSKTDKFSAVVVYKTDRFARNKYDSAIYKKKLRDNGVKIHYAAEAIPEGPEGIILESLMEGLAEYYSAELAQKIKRGIHESALKCKVVGGVAPLGYRVGKDKRYEIDPETSKVVKKIFKMYIEGTPNADICRYLNDLGIKTSRGNAFNKNSINRIISNEKYIGVYETADVRIEDGVPPIISKDIFYLAQKEKENKKRDRKPMEKRADYLLAGKLYCGHCKKPMIGVSGKGKTGRRFFYYYCQTVRNKGNCDKTHVAKDYIEDLVAEVTGDYIGKPEIISEIAHQLYELQKEEDTTAEDIKYLKKKLQDNKKSLDNIMKVIEAGASSDTVFDRIKTLEAEKMELEGELEYYKTVNFGLSEEQLIFFLKSFLKPESREFNKYKRLIIDCFVNKVYIFNDKMTVFYNINENSSPDLGELPFSDTVFRSDKCSTERIVTGDEGSRV